MLEKRFGKLAGWVEERLRGYTVAELEALGDRFPDAASLAQLFG